MNDNLRIQIYDLANQAEEQMHYSLLKGEWNKASKFLDVAYNAFFRLYESENPENKQDKMFLLGSLNHLLSMSLDFIQPKKYNSRKNDK